jgi:cytochrome d ubiquinol oxidase subunit I
MVGMGLLMITLGLLSLWLRYRHRLYHSRPFQWFALCMGPAGLLALLAGWVTTEVGRQPWVVYGYLRTIDAVSLHSTLQMSISLLAFFVVYSSVFGVGYVYLIRLIKKGPQPVDTLTSNTSGTPPVRCQPRSLFRKRRESDGRRYLSYLVCHHRLCHADVYHYGWLRSGHRPAV